MNGLPRRQLLLLLPVALGVIWLALWRDPVAVPVDPAVEVPPRAGRSPDLKAARSSPQAVEQSRPLSNIEKIETVEAGGAGNRTHVSLSQGQTIEVSCRILKPSRLPPDARVRVRWTLVESAQARL
ncbi:MAG: hypothetical protein ABGZ17_03200, partial [Planctomycetaceae bacterium]